MIALIITIYNRAKYVKQCFESLSKLTTQPDITILVDDCSTDLNVYKLCQQMVGATYIRHKKNKGVREALKTGLAEAAKQRATLFINLDSDAVVKPDFIEQLVALKDKFPDKIISGFNNVSDVNPVMETHDDYYVKDYLNGINMCFNASQYTNAVLRALEQPGNWDYNLSVANKPFVVTRPSCVQHIGMESSMGHSGGGVIPDTAQDFKYLLLPNVTLFGIDASNPAGIVKAAEISSKYIQFGATKIITDRIFPGRTHDEGRTNYSYFIMRRLAEYITTSHVLIIHADGYVINWKAWKDEWLEYDYIGATWGYKDNMNVGNGGFSLRSKKLQDILATDRNIVDYHPEDDVICRKYRTYLEENYGIKFAPEHVANEFSIEAYGSRVFPGGNKYSGSFGFHGYNVDFSTHADFDIAEQILP